MPHRQTFSQNLVVYTLKLGYIDQTLHTPHDHLQQICDPLYHSYEYYNPLIFPVNKLWPLVGLGTPFEENDSLYTKLDSLSNHYKKKMFFFLHFPQFD